MRKLTLVLGAISLTLASFAQQDTIRNKKGGGYLFTVQKSVEATEVQNQCKTGTCWSFSALSFFESELLRMGKGKHNLSEMFVVNKAYKDKAGKYVRMHGATNFGAGGAFHDIPYVFEKYGIVPEEVYKGLNYGLDKHNHGEMDDMLTGMLKPLLDEKTLTDGWKNAVSGVVDSYLGAVPENFEYKGKKYTPKSYAESLGLKMSDYVPLTSFSHQQPYSKFILEIPDNWMWEEFYNVSLDEMIQTIDNAIMAGYSVAWAADVSEKGFSFKNGVAIVPHDGEIVVIGKDSKQFNDAGADKEGSVFDAPVKEKTITPEVRQKAFDNYETTDDHGLHITGIVKDQFGAKYYQVKNSWGDENYCKGYLYVSEAYMRYKTIDILVHKDGVPKSILSKLKMEN